MPIIIIIEDLNGKVPLLIILPKPSLTNSYPQQNHNMISQNKETVTKGIFLFRSSLTTIAAARIMHTHAQAFPIAWTSKSSVTKPAKTLLVKNC